jgi:hypothetical protein
MNYPAFDVSIHTIIEVIHLIGIILYLARRFYILENEILRLTKDVHKMKNSLSKSGIEVHE